MPLNLGAAAEPVASYDPPLQPVSKARMRRKPRLHVPGGVYHVILRGNDRQNIFFAAADRRHWMALLRRGLDCYDARVHANSWMTNHIHMAVQVADVPLHRLMQWLAMSYARRINQRLGRTGHLFERRYRACIFVDTCPQTC